MNTVTANKKAWDHHRDECNFCAMHQFAYAYTGTVCRIGLALREAWANEPKPWRNQVK